MDLRTLNLEIVWETSVSDMWNFIETYNLSKEAQKEFECEDLDYLDFSDDEVISELLKYLNKQDRIYFIIYNEYTDAFDIYYITQKGVE